MGLFSRKSKTKEASKSRTVTASAQDFPSTPVQKEPPTTPETIKAAETPNTVPPNPASAASENESQTPIVQPEKAENEEKPASTPAKKKHRTRISVTTPEKNDEGSNDLDLEDESPDLDSFNSEQLLNELEQSDDRSNNEVDKSHDTEADEAGLDSTFLEDDDEEKNGNVHNEEKMLRDDPINKDLLSNFEGCYILPDSLEAMLPESWQQNGQARDEQDTVLMQEPLKKMSYYSEEFATNFLQELLNVAFALVYHQPSLTIEEEKADWQGRSVTMNFKAGVCNALEVFQPEIEWSTMGGGKDTKILTRSVSLIDIHSITVSSTDDMRDNLEPGESEEIQCFFTLTTKSGDIHVFEAMNIKESNRLVLGIKNISGRYSSLIVAGDPRVMVEFFDNSADPQEIRLPFERAIVQVSHAFLG